MLALGAATLWIVMLYEDDYEDWIWFALFAGVLLALAVAVSLIDIIQVIVFTDSPPIRAHTIQFWGGFGLWPVIRPLFA